MKQIIQNLALIETLSYCKKHKIDPSDTHIVKNGRGFKYSLYKNKDGKAIVTVVFHKHAVPSFYLH